MTIANDVYDYIETHIKPKVEQFIGDGECYSIEIDKIGRDHIDYSVIINGYDEELHTTIMNAEHTNTMFDILILNYILEVGNHCCKMIFKCYWRL
jgi:hypothetical protein